MPTPASSPARGTTCSSSTHPRARAPFSRLRLREGPTPGEPSLTRFSFTRWSPTLGTCVRLLSTPRRRLTASSPPEEQEATGVTPGLVRLAVGIEHIDDILADLEAGFAAVAAHNTAAANAELTNA